jgi:hypothetical protein
MIRESFKLEKMSYERLLSYCHGKPGDAIDAALKYLTETLGMTILDNSICPMNFYAKTHNNFIDSLEIEVTMDFPDEWRNLI